MPKSPDPLKSIRARVAKASQEPGVYRWLGEDGTLLYVGKAKNLRNRLKSYLTAKTKELGPWKESMMRQVRDLDVTVTTTELEALFLETNLIEEHRPKYNVLMKDDKNYVYVKVTLQDQFPRIDIVRRIEDDGAKYFGPKTSAWEVREQLTWLRQIFPYRNCRMNIDVAGEVERDGKVVLDVVCKNKDRATPCLDHHIGQCVAPCIGTVTPQEYRTRCIDPILTFLKGDKAAIVGALKDRMKLAAQEKKFELAAQLRDRLARLEAKEEAQVASDATGDDADIVGVAVFSSRAHVVILKRRDGRVVDESSVALQGQAESIEHVLSEFLPLYYSEASEIPGVILIGAAPEDRPVIEAWLTQAAGHRVTLAVPERGTKSKLLELAEKNAQEKARQQETKWETEARNLDDALAQLKDALGLPEIPKRIEGYDISHLGGTETVGSMVVACNGKASSDQYRSFTIHTMKSGVIDDYAALREVLKRRLRHVAGGLVQELKNWDEQGIAIRKARKADQSSLADIRKETQGLPTDESAYKEMYVAVHDEKIVGMARLHHRSASLIELRSVWVHDEYRGKRLGHAIARKVVSSVRKGKIHIVCERTLEQYYAEIGFRHVLKPPPAFVEAIRDYPEHQKQIFMVYDTAQHKPDVSLNDKPDLLMIDGGKGQLRAAVEALQSLDLTIPVISLAKREEDIFMTGRTEPVVIPKESQAQFLLQRLRDEAHRFANKHREGKGLKAVKQSALDTIPGIGPETKKALFTRFGSVDAIKEAQDAVLLEVLTEAQLRALRAAS